MGTMDPNQTLLQGKNQSTPDLTPAPLTGPSSAVSFLTTGVQPPSPLYMSRDDRLVLFAATSLSSIIVQFNLRMLKPDGKIEAMQYTLAPPNTRAAAFSTYDIGEGFLLSISATSTGSLLRGHTFVRAWVQRNAFGNQYAGLALFADYVWTASQPGWPYGRAISPLECPGLLHSVFVSNPGAGVDWVMTVPANARYNVKSIGAVLTTNATAGNRFPYLQIYDGTSVQFNSPPSQAIPASTACQLSANSAYNPVAATLTAVTWALPVGLTLQAANTMRSFTAGILGTDAWTNIDFLVEEWIEI